MKIDSLIFDLDGTLWDSSEGIVATWALVLENYPEIHKKVTAEELASNFGLPLEQIALQYVSGSAGITQTTADGRMR